MTLCDLWPKTSGDWAAWIQAIGTILVVIGAFAVALYQASLTRKRDRTAKRDRVEGMWMAIRSEVARCGNTAKDFYDARIRAPSYRFATVAYDKILPELLIEARLNAQDTQDLITFFANVEAINIGLDIAQEMHNVGNMKRLEEQASVNFSKADKYVRQDSEGYKAAMAVIERHMANTK